eukprot:1800640-Rhodomonas_salina.1
MAYQAPTASNGSAPLSATRCAVLRRSMAIGICAYGLAYDATARCLGPCYAVSGTEVGYGATRRASLSALNRSSDRRCAVLRSPMTLQQASVLRSSSPAIGTNRHILLRIRYALSGTEIGSATTRRHTTG